MGKTLFFKLFGAGKIPSQLRQQLESEGILVQDEGIRGSATYRNFRRPGTYSGWRRQWYSASLTVTRTRLVGLANSQPIINVPFSDERYRRLAIAAENVDTLLVGLDASLFHADWSGSIEYRFRTSEAQVFLATLKAQAT